MQAGVQGRGRGWGRVRVQVSVRVNNCCKVIAVQPDVHELFMYSAQFRISGSVFPFLMLSLYPFCA